MCFFLKNACRKNDKRQTYNFTFYFSFYNSLYGRKYEISMREMLANIVKSGSKDFRNFIKLEYDFELEPLIIRNTIEQKQI